MATFRYLRRYTSDCMVIAGSNNIDELKDRSDYKVHIWDTLLGKVAWQNAKSVRYGDVQVA